MLVGYEHHLGVGDGFDGRIHVEAYALLFFYLFAQTLGDVFVEHRQTFFEILDDGDLGAEAREDGGKLHAYDARANDDYLGWQRLEVECLGRGDDARIGDAVDGGSLALEPVAMMMSSAS